MTELTTMKAIAQLVPQGSRVLDLGCGDGALLEHLVRERGCTGYGVELDDAMVVAIVDKLITQRKDSIDAFVKAERQELADKEAAEMKVLQAYLPQRMSADEVLVEVKAIVAELGASGPGDMGKVMGVVKTRLAGKAEMSAVSAAVKTALAG